MRVTSEVSDPGEFDDPGVDVITAEETITAEEAVAAEEAAAERRASSIEAGRRKGGAAGAAMAGAMLAISEIYEGPKRDEIVAVSESPDEPGDIDKDGMRIDVGDVSVESILPDDQPPSSGV